MPKIVAGAHRDELEAVIDFFLKHTKGEAEDYDTAQGILAIAGSLGMFCHCTEEQLYLQPMSGCAEARYCFKETFSESYL